MSSLFHRPEVGVLGDVIPFYWEGNFHLFYLREYRDWAGRGEGTPWWHLVTRDFVHFEDWGEAIPRGGMEDQDLYAFTGCVLEREGMFHIFYTGHNRHFPPAGKVQQVVLHATSPDLRTWTKDPEFRFAAPVDAGYEPHDWRDPFVYWDDRLGKYAMLLAARRGTAPKRNRGCVALATSADLKRWMLEEPFWAPEAYITHECPDLFRMGEWWYLIYSTYSERLVTHYRAARSLDGPWIAPENPDGGDAFDGRAFYAAKTASDGQRRYAFGWLPIRDPETDQGAWQWGGNLVTHELVQQPNGALTVRAPESVLATFGPGVPLNLQPVTGCWRTDGDVLESQSVGRVSTLLLGMLADTALVETTVTSSAETTGIGLLLQADESLESYHQLRLEPRNQRVVLDCWERPADQPFLVERPIRLRAGEPVTIRVILDGSCMVAYLNDRVALSWRIYSRQNGRFGLFVSEGDGRFEATTVRGRTSLS